MYFWLYFCVDNEILEHYEYTHCSACSDRCIVVVAFVIVCCFYVSLLWRYHRRTRWTAGSVVLTLPPVQIQQRHHPVPRRCQLLPKADATSPRSAVSSHSARKSKHCLRTNGHVVGTLMVRRFAVALGSFFTRYSHTTVAGKPFQGMLSVGWCGLPSLSASRTYCLM